MSTIFDKTLSALNTSINMRQLRHDITSSNIANAETPGYKAKQVDFEAALKRALELESLYPQDDESLAIGAGSPSKIRADVYDNPDVNVTNDGNTVDLEKEMATLAENSLIQKAAMKLINKKLAALRYAVTEGSR